MSSFQSAITDKEREFLGEPGRIASLMADRLRRAVMGAPSQADTPPLPGDGRLTGGRTESSLSPVLPQGQTESSMVPALLGGVADHEVLNRAVASRPQAPPPQGMNPAAIATSSPHALPMPPGRLESLPMGGGKEVAIERLAAATKDAPGAASGISSAAEPSSLGSVSHATSTTAGMTPGKNDYAELLGGKHVMAAESEMDKARKEMSDFGDSAGKWWSVLLAAMFPQYGNVLNMMQNFKQDKYRAAYGKYHDMLAAAVKSRDSKPTNISGMPGWMMINGQAVQVADPQAKETRYTWDGKGLPQAISIPRGSNPNVSIPSDAGPTPEVTSYDDATLRTLLTQGGLTGRAGNSREARLEEILLRFEKDKELKQLEGRNRERVAWINRTAGREVITQRDLADIEKQVEDGIDYMDKTPAEKAAIKDRLIQKRADDKLRHMMPVGTGAPTTVQGSSSTNSAQAQPPPEGRPRVYKPGGGNKPGGGRP